MTLSRGGRLRSAASPCGCVATNMIGDWRRRPGSVRLLALVPASGLLCLDLAVTTWWSRRHAEEGRADAPALLAAAEHGDSDVWSDLRDRLCDQGTTTAAGYPPVPHLAAIALPQEPAPFIAPLFLVASILAATSRPAGVDVAEVRRHHAPYWVNWST